MDSKTLRILCFGDSLTSGYCHFGLDSHPYSIQLEDRLSAALPGTKVQVSSSGVPGDVVRNRPFKIRLERELQKMAYDWVIMLGGTNDIGHALSADSTFEALEEMWDMVLAKGSKLLALTVPECSVKVGWLDENRNNLNRRILTHNPPNFHAFDLRLHIPYHTLSESERDNLWDDGLHLSPQGYNWMGNQIADALLPFLQSDGHLAATASSAKNPVRNTDDDRVFVEEGGSSKDISQGYVVVRKKDLE